MRLDEPVHRELADDRLELVDRGRPGDVVVAFGQAALLRGEQIVEGREQ
jgi:hypothetical protein